MKRQSLKSLKKIRLPNYKQLERRLAPFLAQGPFESYGDLIIYIFADFYRATMVNALSEVWLFYLRQRVLAML